MSRRLLSFLFVIASAAHGEEGFAPIFDGKSLAGWVGQDMSFWTVEDEAITGTISPAHRPPMNQYIVWQGGLVEDFELKLDFRLTGSTTPDTNGGFQYRSRRLPNGDVGGYQVDNNLGQPWKVRLYDEFGRHDLAFEGEKGTFSPAGKRSVELLTLESGARDFRLEAWHEYHLVAVGNHFKLHVNGKLVAEAIDQDADSSEARGILAMQLHTGPPMKAQFKNIRLKVIRVTSADSRDAQFAYASLHWTLQERMNAHQPPLAALGEVRVDPKRGAEFRDGHIHAQVDLNQPRAWNTSGHEMTVHAHATLPMAEKPMCYFSKGDLEKSGQYWLGVTPSEEGKSQLTFALATTTGPKRIDAPLPDGATGEELHDIVGRYDGTKLELYLDGKRVAQVSAAGDLVRNDAPILLGASSGDKEPGHLFRGTIHEVTLWPRGLADEEIVRIGQR